MEEDTPDITVWPPHVHALKYVCVHARMCAYARARTHTYTHTLQKKRKMKA